MSRVDWMAWVWPGLPQLWRKGSWLGLAAAVAFAAAFNVALVNSLIWTDWFGPAWRATAWIGAAAIWMTGVVCTWRTQRPTQAAIEANETPACPSEDLFSAATREYLQGNWLAAGERLERLLANNGDDIEARLLLATLYRRTRRVSEARAELERLRTMEKATAWQFEIDRELEWLDRLPAEPVGDEATRDNPQTAPTCKAA
jgi:hypothetical protein